MWDSRERSREAEKQRSREEEEKKKEEEGRKEGRMDGEMEEEEEERKEGRGDAIHLMSKFAAARCLSKSLARNSPTGKHRRAVVKTLMKLGVCWREHSVCMCACVCVCMCVCICVCVGVHGGVARRGHARRGTHTSRAGTAASASSNSSARAAPRAQGTARGGSPVDRQHTGVSEDTVRVCECECA